MKTYPKTIILRHRKENLKKCSLRGLETREDMEFYTYPKKHLHEREGYVLLSLEGKELSKEDADKGLYLIDGTWKLAEKMDTSLPFTPERRSLPKGFRTAYPRRQHDCPDEEIGLASIEALYIAYTILGRSTKGLLDGYHFSTKFLEKNKGPLNMITTKDIAETN